MIMSSCKVKKIVIDQRFFSDTSQELEEPVLLELLEKSEIQSHNELERFVYINGKNVQLKKHFDLKEIKKQISKQSIDFVPYWKVKNRGDKIIVLSGKGLWNDIWGYALIDFTTTKIKRISFGHKEETPGLGALISESDFESKFIGYKVGEFNKLEIKRPQDSSKGHQYEIDGISGATITCSGVNQMIKESGKLYSPLSNN